MHEYCQMTAGYPQECKFSIINQQLAIIVNQQLHCKRNEDDNCLQECEQLATWNVRQSAKEHIHTEARGSGRRSHFVLTGLFMLIK